MTEAHTCKTSCPSSLPVSAAPESRTCEPLRHRYWKFTYLLHCPSYKGRYGSGAVRPSVSVRPVMLNSVEVQNEGKKRRKVVETSNFVRISICVARVTCSIHFGLKGQRSRSHRLVQFSNRRSTVTEKSAAEMSTMDFNSVTVGFSQCSCTV